MDGCTKAEKGCFPHRHGSRSAHCFGCADLLSSSSCTWTCPGLRLLWVLLPHKSITPRRPALAVCPLDPPGWMPLLLQRLSLPLVLRQASGTIIPGSLKTDRPGNEMPTSRSLATLPMWFRDIGMHINFSEQEPWLGSQLLWCWVPGNQDPPCLSGPWLLPQREHSPHPDSVSAFFCLLNALVLSWWLAQKAWEEDHQALWCTECTA